MSATTVPAGGSCITSNLGTQLAPTALTDGSATGICLTISATGFANGDEMYTLSVVWNHTALANKTFEVQVGVQVTPTAHNVVATAFVKTSLAITVNETAVFAIDLTQQADTSVTGYQVLVTEL